MAVATGANAARRHNHSPLGRHTLPEATRSPEALVGELLEFAQTVAANVVGNQPVPAPETKEEKYLSRTEVMEIFGISSATLWRWSKDCPASQD